MIATTVGITVVVALLGGFGPQIDQLEIDYSLPGGLLHALVQVESNSDPFAVGALGEAGLCQIHPVTAVAISNTIGIRADLIMSDPGANLEAGAFYLSSMIALFDGDVALALSAYNGGPGRVLDCRCVIPTTRRYVDAVLSFYSWVPLKPAPVFVPDKVCWENRKVCIGQDAGPSPAARAVFRHAAPAQSPGVPFCVGGTCVEEDAAAPAARATPRSDDPPAYPPTVL